MKTFIIIINGKYLKDFETKDIKDEQGNTGWMSIRKTFKLTCPVFTTNINYVKKIDGNINLKSCIDKILHWMKETNKIKKLEIDLYD